MDSFWGRFRIVEDFDQRSKSNFLQKYLTQGLIQWDHVVDSTDDWSLEGLILRCSETVCHDHQSIDLGKIEANLLSLGSDVFDTFTTVDFDNLIFVIVFKDSQKCADQTERNVPLHGILIDLSGPVEKQFSKGGHGFAPDFLAFVFGDGLNKTRNDSVL